jgi:hypothetical protein
MSARMALSLNVEPISRAPWAMRRRDRLRFPDPAQWVIGGSFVRVHLTPVAGHVWSTTTVNAVDKMIPAGIRPISVGMCHSHSAGARQIVDVETRVAPTGKRETYILSMRPPSLGLPYDAPDRRRTSDLPQLTQEGVTRTQQTLCSS